MEVLSLSPPPIFCSLSPVGHVCDWLLLWQQIRHTCFYSALQADNKSLVFPSLLPSRLFHLVLCPVCLATSPALISSGSAFSHVLSLHVFVSRNLSYPYCWPFHKPASSLYQTPFFNIYLCLSLLWGPKHNIIFTQSLLRSPAEGFV